MNILNSVKYICVTAFLLIFFITASSFNSEKDAQDNKQHKKVFTVVIDPGHGGAALGAVGRRSKEKDIVLQVAKKLKKQLEEKMNINVLLTRETDVDVAFRTRSDLANKNNADLFISIHANSANSARRRNPQVTGTETLVLGFHRMNEQDVAIRENADILLEDNYQENNSDLIGFDPKDPSSYIVFKVMRRQHRDRSIKLAALIQNEFITSNRPNRGVKEQGLAVLARASMPAVLTEIGFISSPKEEDYMLSEEGQSEIVNNIYNAINNYKTTVER